MGISFKLNLSLTSFSATSGGLSKAETKSNTKVMDLLFGLHFS